MLSSLYFSFTGKESEAHASYDLPEFTSVISGRAVIENSVELDKNKIRNGVQLLEYGLFCEIALISFNLLNEPIILL